MSEPIVNPDANGTPSVQPPATYTKAELDSAAAGARKEAEAKLKEASERLTALEAKEKERIEAEMTEIEKLKKQIGDYEESNTSITTERDSLKAAIDKINEQMAEKVEKEMEGLSDEQKKVIQALPLEMQLDGISQFKQIDPKPGEWGKSERTTIKENLTAAEAFEIRDKYGTNSPEYKKALAVRRKILGK